MRMIWVVWAALTIGCGREPAESPITASEHAERELAQAKAAATAEARDAAAAKAVIERLQRDLDDLEARIAAATDAVASARSAADRESAAAALQQLRGDRGELEARIAAAVARATRLERTQPSQGGCSTRSDPSCR